MLCVAILPAKNYRNAERCRQNKGLFLVCCTRWLLKADHVAMHVDDDLEPHHAHVTAPRRRDACLKDLLELLVNVF